MSKKSIPARYKAKAIALLPQHRELIDIVEALEAEHGTENVTPDQIDEATFSESEYLGGMADAILAMLHAEDRS